MQLIDSHCHLNFEGLAERLPEVLANMAANQVAQALAISVSRESFEEVLAIAQAHDNIYASVGVHPDREDAKEFSIAEMCAHAAHPKVVGIGETGLDYHWCKGDLAWQQRRFAEHIEAANQSGLPLIVHTRDAADDTLAVMRAAGADAAGGVMHCFTESWEVASAALDLGFYLSFSGIVTFKSASALKDVARKVPLDRLLIETDSPYLAPVPHRGQENEPAYVRDVAEYVAWLRNTTVEEIAALTSENFFRLFPLASR